MANNYWHDREAEQRKHNILDDQKFEKIVHDIYINALDNIQKEIDSFYVKYANKEKITISEAKKRASIADIEAYQRKAKRYVEEKNFSDMANTEMRLYNLTMKVNRLELLKANIGTELVSATNEFEKKGFDKLLERTNNEFKRQAGILGNTVLENAKGARALVNASFKNATFSDRVWINHETLKYHLDSLLTKGLISGQNPRKLVSDFRKSVESSVSNAQRLMRTELTRLQTSVQALSYQELGFEEYEFIALGNACEHCRALDGKHFKVIKMMPGENAAPIHPNCRCSSAPYQDTKEYEEWLNYLESGGTTEEWKSLTMENKYAIKSYVSSMSYLINDALRNDYSLTSEQKKIVKDLDDALSKMHTYNGTLTRSIFFYDQQSINNFLEVYKEGSTVISKQYLSTTKDNIYNPDAQVQLIILNSKNGINISTFNQGEDEVLYKRNSKFKILRRYIKNNVVYIELEEV